MKVNSQLERAQLENLTSLPSAATAGRVAFDTVEGKAFLDDGTIWRAFLRNDGKAIIGNNGTGANNIRFHRGANGVLQLVSGADSTAEGTLSTALNQLSARAENYVAAGKPAFGNAGRIAYITDTGFLNLDTGAAWKELVDANSTQTITGKTLTSPVLNTPTLNGAVVADFLDMTQIATPATPAAGHNKIYTKSDKQLYLLDETGLETQVGSGGGGGGKNYLSTVNNINGNGNFELGSTTKWSLFNTTLTSLIPTGTISAGAGSITTFAVTTSGKLAGVYSLSVEGSGAISAGQGFLTDAVTFDLEDQVKVCSFKFSYKVVSGLSNLNFSGTSANTFAVYIYDVTNSVWIQPAGVYSMDQGSGVGTAQGTFQTTGASQYRLAVVCVNASAGAASMLFDSFEVGPQKITQGTPVTDWIQYTPTFTGFGTPSSVNFEYRRVGDSIEIRGNFVSGTSTAVEGRVSLPAGVVSKSTLPAISIVGEQTQNEANTPTAYFVLGEPSVSYVTFSVRSAGSVTALTKLNGNGLISNGSTLSMKATIPVQGWSSNVTMSSDADTRVVNFSASNEAGYSQTSNAANTIMTFASGDVINDTHAGWNAGTSTYTVPVSGLYMIYMQGTVNTGTGTNRIYALRPKVNGTFFNLSGEYVPTGLSQTATGYRVISLKAGDQIVPEAIYDAAGTFTISNCAFTLTRISGPSQIAASEAIIATYEYAAGGTTANNAETTVPWDTKINDTHGAMNTSTGVFTCPAAGVYEISAIVGYASNTNGSRYLLMSQAGSVTKDYRGQQTNSPGTGAVVMCGVASFKCKAGDTLQVKGFQSSGGSLALNGAGQNCVTIKRIGN